MSVVSIIIHNTCALMVSDTKLNDNPHLIRLKKIFKKENILLGFTGNVEEVFDYLNPIFTNTGNLNPSFSFGSSEDFIKMLDDKFYTAIKQNKKYDTVIAIGAKLGNKYIAKRYCLTDCKELKISSDMLISTDEIQYFYLGEEVHNNYFYNLLVTENPTKMDDIIILFKKALNYGINYDESINNELDYEYINLNSFI